MDGGVSVVHRVVDIAFGEIGVGAIGIGQHVVGINADRVIRVTDGAIIVAMKAISVGAVGECDGAIDLGDLQLQHAGAAGNDAVEIV